MLLFAFAAFADPCSGRTPCHIVETTPTPVGVVSKLVLHRDPKARFDYGDPDSCVPTEWVLSAPGKKPRTVLAVCNDGYGASGVGEDDVSIHGTRFRHTQYGGSAWRWSVTNEIDLATTKMVEEARGGWFMVLGGETTWNWLQFTGQHEQTYARCDDEEQQLEVRGPVIPRVSAPDFQLASTELGRCALRVDSASGAIVYGRAGRANDASFRAVFIGDALIIEVEDDAFVPKARSWVRADHLEIWVGSQSIPIQGCMKDSLPMKQWGISLTGEVFPAHGDPAPVQVQVATDGKRKRFEVRGLPEFERISIVYSDSDDGKQQERLIGTSRVVFGKGESLGSTFTVKPEHGRCEGKKVLTPVQTRSFRSDEPLLPGIP